MSIRADLEKLKTGTRDLRKFGLTVGGVFMLLGGALLLRHRLHYSYFVAAGAALIGSGIIWPRALKYIYIAWMTLAFALGSVMSSVILTAFFFLFVTPVGLLARLFRKDFLTQKLDAQAETYWIPRSKEIKTLESYERQF